MKTSLQKSRTKRKSLKKLFQFSLLFIYFFNTAAKAQPPVDPSSIIGKVVCGYQAWFSATGDGSPINRWTHWSPGTAPQPGIAPNPNPNLTFDAYPDVSIYNPASLFQTNFANQGNGNPAQLFSSFRTDVIDKQFSLLQANGIDGVAFQRFIWEVLVDPAFKALRDSSAVHVRASAEKYQRMFYLTYDLTGLGNVQAASDQVRFDSVKGDWQNNMVGKLQFNSSPMYAKQGGKPVVQIWGIGYNTGIGTAAQQLDLINWFQSQGCYVIIGVPIDWRNGTGASKPGWINTYKAANMISPWAVGAYTDQTSTDNYKNNYLVPDLNYCNSNGIAYQPVIFPGFSWSNWNGGAQNQIPRSAGNFFWHQATNLRSLGITTAEIAMADEYDEGTAIMPMADGYNMIPTNQYFVTTSADGIYLSSDFYLRLATKITKQINGTDPPISSVPVPYSVGPIFFRTSNEAKYDAQPTWSNTTDYKSNVTAYGSNYGNPGCAVIQANAHKGQYSLKISGRDRSSGTSYAYFRVWSVNIPVSSTTQLSFWNYPVNTLGRYASVDLTMSDGSTLRDSGAQDSTGISMHPAAGRGIVNTWTKTLCNIGTWLNGKTIVKIMVAYDHGAATGDFSAYFDDISINTAGSQQLFISPTKKLSFSAKGSKNDVVLTLQTTKDENVKHYEIERSIDGVQYNNIQTLIPSEEAGMKSYAVTDADVMVNFKNANQFYYRLKTINSGDNISYSKILSIKNETLSQQVYILNNPFGNGINIRLANPPKDKALLRLYDASGKLLIAREIKNAGNYIHLNTPFGASSGTYILESQIDGRSFINKLVKE
ncbi:MAG: T9SS type A sorting domain-containing protein [Bacteroidota bacterium]|nr:T9SS type A sorting domain-containing protein [Bacteroidota bacterium]